jgi:carboxylesterase
MEVLRREHVEDLHRMAGIRRETAQARIAVEAPPMRSALDRLPWLLVGLVGSMLATLLVASELGDQLSGIILVNPMIHVRGISPTLAFAISRVIKFGKSVGGDIKRKGATEYSYDKLPYRGIHQLLLMLKVTREKLPKIEVPMQLFHSVDDHTLPASNTEIIMREIGSSNKSRIELLNSFHVATLDHDNEMIFENSVTFIRSLRNAD